MRRLQRHLSHIGSISEVGFWFHQWLVKYRLKCACPVHSSVDTLAYNKLTHWQLMRNKRNLWYILSNDILPKITTSCFLIFNMFPYILPLYSPSSPNSIFLVPLILKLGYLSTLNLLMMVLKNSNLACMTTERMVNSMALVLWRHLKYLQSMAIFLWGSIIWRIIGT